MFFFSVDVKLVNNILFCMFYLIYSWAQVSKCTLSNEKERFFLYQCILLLNLPPQNKPLQFVSMLAFERVFDILRSWFKMKNN